MYKWPVQINTRMKLDLQEQNTMLKSIDMKGNSNGTWKIINNLITHLKKI